MEVFYNTLLNGGYSMKGNLSLVALLSLVIAAPTFAMWSDDVYTAKLVTDAGSEVAQAAIEEAGSEVAPVITVRRRRFRSCSSSKEAGVAPVIKEAAQKSAGHLFRMTSWGKGAAQSVYSTGKSVAQAGLDKTVNGLSTVATAASNNPYATIAGVTGAVVVVPAVRTWRNTPGTRAQKAKAVVTNPIVATVTTLGLVEAGLHAKGYDVVAKDLIVNGAVKATNSVVAYSPKAVDAAKFAMEAVQAHPYIACAVAAVPAAYGLFRAYNVIIGAQYRGASQGLVDLQTPIRVARCGILTGDDCLAAANAIDSYVLMSRNRLDFILEFKTNILLNPALTELIRKQIYEIYSPIITQDDDQVTARARTNLSAFANELRDEAARRADALRTAPAGAVAPVAPVSTPSMLANARAKVASMTSIGWSFIPSASSLKFWGKTPAVQPVISAVK